MKKIYAGILAMLIAALLAACAPTQTSIPAATETPTATATAEGTQEPAAQTLAPTEAPTQTPDTAKAGEALQAILSDISANYHTGTAGCSLVAAKYAAMLLDWHAQYVLDAAEISTLSSAFYDTLTADAATTMTTEQMEDVYNAAVELLGDNALDLLESAGYTPVAYPWNEEDMKALFTAVYGGLGIISLPA